MDTPVEAHEGQAELRLCELGVFGVRNGERWISVRGERSAVFLAALAVGGQFGVRTEELIETIWPSPDQPEFARQSLANMVSRFRAAHGRSFVESTKTGYRLGDHVDSDRVCFASEVKSAAEMLENDPTAALDTVSTAMKRWRGEPWTGIERPLNIAGDRADLLELYALARRSRAAALLTLGRASEALGDLRRMVDDDPFDEIARHQLARALADSGHRSEALRSIQELRLLLSERGLFIDPALGHLEMRLLGAEDSASAERTMLPEQNTPFVGRQAESHDIETVLSDERLVTLHGPGGAGKTRLAVHVVATSDEPVCGFVDLAAARPGSEVWLAFARGIGLPRDRIEALDIGERPVVLAGAVASMGGVLVIDNCEHVVGEVREFLTHLLGQPGDVRVLATSRTPLNVARERRYPIPAFVDGVELFCRRAADMGVVIGREQHDAVGAICNVVDDLPLAIEIAAAQTPYRTLEEIAGELERGVQHHDVTQGDPRHVTMTAAIRWSHDLLDQDVGDGLLRLGILGAPFQMSDAASVLDEGDVPRVLDALVHSSLLQRDGGGKRSTYRLLMPVQLYSLSELHRLELHQDVALQLAEWLLQVTKHPFGDTWFRFSVADELSSRLPFVWPAVEALTAAGRTNDAARLASRFAGTAYLFGQAGELIEALVELWPATTEVDAAADALFALALCAMADRRFGIFGDALGQLGSLEGADELPHRVFTDCWNSLWVMWAELLVGGNFELAHRLLVGARRKEAASPLTIHRAAIEMFQSGIHLLGGDWVLAEKAARRSIDGSGGTTFDLTATAVLCFARLHLGDPVGALRTATAHAEWDRYAYIGNRLAIVSALASVQLGDVAKGLSSMSVVQQRALQTSFPAHRDDAAVATCYIAHMLDRDDLARTILESGVGGQGPWVGHLVPKLCRDLDLPLTTRYNKSAGERRQQSERAGVLGSRVLDEMVLEYGSPIG